MLLELLTNIEDFKGLFCRKTVLIHSLLNSYYQQQKEHIIVS
jgi:hypothetical protein